MTTETIDTVQDTETRLQILGIVEVALPGAEFISDVRERNESIPDNFPRLAKLNITRFNTKGVFHNRRASRHASLMIKHQAADLQTQTKVAELISDKQKELVKDAVDKAVTGTAA